MIREFQEEIMRLKAELETGGAGGGGLGGIGEEEEELSAGPLPPRIEKKTEYKEKIIEKVVEKEVVIEQGPSPEELAAVEAQLRKQNDEFRAEAERRKKEVELQRNLAESQRKKMIEEIERE